MTTSSSPTMDFLVHSKVRIAAPPDAIWPHLATFDWIESPFLVPMAGTPGQVGERFEAYADARRQVLLYHAVNVELVPGERRTMRMETLDGHWMGFVTFELLDLGAETMLGYDVYVRPPIPEGQTAEAALAQGRAGGDQSLLRLKALIERPEAAAL